MDLKNSKELRTLHLNYRQRTEEFQVTWDDTFRNQQRPDLYKESSPDDTLPPIAEASTFISQLADAEQMPQKELFVALENGQMALQAAQDEYLAIEMVLRHLQGSNTDEIHDPQKLQDFDEYEERKRAMLYGYKYDPKITVTSLKIQDPFAQGGFVPNDSQTSRMKKAALAAGADLNDIDGFTPIEKSGKHMLPRLYWEKKKPKPKLAPTPVRQTRKRSHDELDQSDVSRPVSSEGDAKLEIDEKRFTRYAGSRVPATREATSTPRASPTPKRRRHEPPVPSLLSAAPSPAPEGSPVPSPVPADSSRNTPTPRAKHPAKPKIDKEAPKWTDATLLEAIRKDPTFLHPTDPVKREQRRKKLLEAPNPVRSYSMFSKWGDWRAKGEDKRPRKKNGGNLKE